MSSPVTIPIRSLPRKPQFASNFSHCIGAASNVHSARVGSDLYISLNACRQYSPHQRHEIFCVTGIGIAGFLFLHDRHRDLGEVVEHQIVDWSTFNLAHGCVEKISPEALPCGYTYLLFHRNCRNAYTAQTA